MSADQSSPIQPTASGNGVPVVDSSPEKEVTFREVTLGSGGLNLDPAALEVIERYQEQHQRLTTEMGFDQFLQYAEQFQELGASPHQRLHAAITSSGTDGEFQVGNETYPIYSFLKDPENGGQEALYGADRTVHALASQLLVNENRVFVLYGPTGTGKNTLMRLIKRNSEAHSRTDAGAVMELGFIDPDKPNEEPQWSSKRENPLHAIPKELRPALLPWMRVERGGEEDSSYVPLRGGLSKESRDALTNIMKHDSVKGSFVEAMKYLRVRRYEVSEDDGRGIAAFVPRTVETKHSSADAEGAATATVQVNDAETPISKEDIELIYNRYMRANGGILELQEIQRLPSPVRSTIITSPEDGVIESPDGYLEPVNVVIIAHTTKDEYFRLIQDKSIARRVVGIPIEYCTRASDEQAIYDRDYHEGSPKVTKHMAPLLTETMADWAILTRIKPTEVKAITSLQKVRLYDGTPLPNVTGDQVTKMRGEHVGEDAEGMIGEPPASNQNRIAALLGDERLGFVSPYDFIKRVEEEIAASGSASKIEGAEEKLAELKADLDRKTLEHVKEAYLKNDDKLYPEFSEYVLLVKAYTQRERVKDKFTQASEEPSEAKMRAIEELLDIPQSQKDEFRQGVMNTVGALEMALSMEMMQAFFHKKPELRIAIAKKLNQGAATAKLGDVLEKVREKQVGPKTTCSVEGVQEGYNQLIAGLIDRYGYSNKSAESLVQRIASRDDLHLDEDIAAASKFGFVVEAV